MLKERIWFFDFDGTLSPIVADRYRAELHPACARMLKELLRLPLQHVAVLSSRRLDDLIGRVPLEGVFLGGTSGTEWQVPGGHRMVFSGTPARVLESRRRVLIPEIRRLAALPGIELEDKRWSVALHTRHAPPDSGLELDHRLASWHPGAGIRVFRGPEVYEIQLEPRISKSFGVRMLCRFMKFNPRHGTLFYAGDDENDARAMRLVTRLGGTAITVGTRALIPTATVVADQRELTEEVRRLAGTDPDRFRQEIPSNSRE